MIARLKCWWSGHKRGKRVRITIEGEPGVMVTNQVECPRCKATWTRKVKA